MSKFCHIFLLTILANILFSQTLMVAKQENISQSPKVNICLCMIVKNESKIITRCLDSVKNIVDCISICDTGSTDQTPEIIGKYMAESKIPGRVHRHIWQNFGHNRTLSAQAAQRTLIELGFKLENSYLLFLDADMILAITQDFNKQNLNADAYQIVQRTEDQVYYNIRLAKSSLPFKSIGVTHEYWSTDLPFKLENLDSIYINDISDGGCKSDKFSRDIKLLTQGLIDEPHNTRYMFYLAQSYYCISDYNNAILWYKNRIKSGGWKEEIWYSMYMIANCYKLSTNPKKASKWYLKSYEFNPVRAEPLFELASHYQSKNQHNLAFMFAQIGKKIPYPKEQILFITPSVYDYKFDEILSVSAYHTPFFKKAGLDSIDKLILSKSLSLDAKEALHKDLLFYLQKLPHLEHKKIEFNLPIISKDPLISYRPCNPSIIATETGYMVICKTVNYINDHWNFKPQDGSDLLKTQNVLLFYDKDFDLKSQCQLTDKSNLTRYKSMVVGLEDARIFYLNNNYWFSCSTYDTNPEKFAQVSLCKLGKSFTKNNINIENVLPLKGHIAKKVEKNWLPFVIQNKLHMIYSYNPFVIYEPDTQTGKNNIILNKYYEHDFSRFRGSAAPIEFDNGYLLMVHEVIFDKQRYYAHRFLYLDKSFNIIKLSRPFIFKHKGIEFCCSMTIDHDKKRLIMPIGIEDREAFLCFLDLDQVKSMLINL